METMTPEWQSTINNAYTTPDRLHPVLKQAIPSLLKDKIDRLANLSLFQNNVREGSFSSQVTVDMRFTEDSLKIRLSKNGPWISLLPSSKSTMTPEERAVDGVRKDVMEKIALLWGGISGNSPSESDAGIKSTSESSTSGRSTSIPERTRSKRSRRSERNRRIDRNKEPSSVISANKIDYSTNTTNNYYCCVGSHNRPSNNTTTEENPQPHRGNVTTQTDPKFKPVFRNQNIPRRHREPDSSSDDSEHRSTNSFRGKRPMRHKPLTPSSDSEISEANNSSSEDDSSTSFFSNKSSKGKPFSKDFDLDISSDSSNEDSDHSSANSFSSKSSKGKPFSKDFDLDISSDSSNEDSDHSSANSFSSKSLKGKPFSNNSNSKDFENVIIFSDSDDASDTDHPTTLPPKENIPVIELGPSDDLENLENRIISDSDDQSEYSSTSYYTGKSEFFSDSDISDIENEISYPSSRNDESDLTNYSSSKKKRGIFSNSFDLENLENRIISDSDDQSEYSSTSYYTGKSEFFSDSDISDIENEISYPSSRNDESDLTNYSSSKKKRGIFSNSFNIDNIEPMPILRPTPPKAVDPYLKIKKFIETYDRESKPTSHLVALFNLQSQLAQEKPNRTTINNLLSFLQGDSLQLEEEPIHTVVKSLNTASTETDVNITAPKATQTTKITPVANHQEIQTDSQTVSAREQGTSTDLKTLNSASTETDVNITAPKATQTTKITPVANHQEIQTDSQTVSAREQGTSTDLKTLNSASTETDVNITAPKATQTTKITPVANHQEIQTDFRAISREQSTNTENSIDITAQSVYIPSTETEYSSLESTNDIQGFVSTEDITRLNTFINFSIEETDAFIDMLNTSEDEIDLETISSLVENRGLLINVQDLLYSDPQLAIGSDKVNRLLDELDLDTLKLIHNTPNLEIPYINKEDYSDDESTLVGPEESVFESEISGDEYIDDELIDQLNVGIRNLNSFNNQYEDELSGLLPSNLFGEEELNNNIVYTSTQTDPYVTANELQLQERLRKLELVLERTKSIHKDELASLLRAQDRLQSEANKRIQETLKSSIETEQSAFSRAQDAHKRYKKLLEDTATEITSLKESLAKFETIDQAKKTEFHSFRSKIYSPSPEAVAKITKTEMQDKATQVENIRAPIINDDAKGVIPKAKAGKKSKASSSKFKKKEYNRDLAVMEMHSLRAEKAKLDLDIPKSNHLPKNELAEKKAYLKRVEDELTRKNQKPQKGL